MKLCSTTTEKISVTSLVFLVTWTYLKFVASCSNLRQNIQQTLKVGESTKNKINVKRPRVLERNVGPNHCDDTALILDPGDTVLVSQRMNTEFSLISWCEQDLFRTIWELSEYYWWLLYYLITHSRSITWNVTYHEVPNRLAARDKILSKDNKSYECLEKNAAAYFVFWAGCSSTEM